MHDSYATLSLTCFLISAILGGFAYFFWKESARYSDTYRSYKLRRRALMLCLLSRIATVVFLVLGVYFFLI